MARVVTPRRASRRRPFWLPASSYYVLVAAIAIATFFLVLGIFSQGVRDENHWVLAGLASSGVLAGGVLVREVILRTLRNRMIADQNRLEANLRRAFPVPGRSPKDAKITLEQNAAALARIREKSDAAKVFARVADGHREVFELCDDYRRTITAELATVHPGSPRVAAFIRGRELAAEYHHFHMMRWVELESKRLVEESRSALTIGDKMLYAEQSAAAVEVALHAYPDNQRLIDSATALDEMRSILRVSELLERAEQTALLEYGSAEVLYAEALRVLERLPESGERDSLISKAETGLARLQT